MIELVGRCMNKNSSGYEYSMVWNKLYSETDTSEGSKEGVSVGEEVEFEDGTTVGWNDGTVEG